MTTAETLERGRAAFEVSAWVEAYDCLAAADAEASLAPTDIELFASAAYLIGRDDESSALWARAHRAYLDRGDVELAAGCAAWLAFGLLNRGEMVQAGSWIMRAVKLLDDGRRDCVQAGYLVLLSGIKAMFAGDDEAAAPQIDQAVAIADRFGDQDLRTLACTGRGQALLAQGRIDEGIAVLDEVMVATTSGEVSATVAGLAYCAVITACHAIFDVRRAQEWSAALAHWCDDQPDLVPYTGWCQVHRAEIMELRGTWAEALDAATRAYERSLLSTDQAIGGAARYLLGDVHRLRGALEPAEEAYREANRLGCEPQPGLALLRLAQGQLDAAASTVRRVLDERADPASRARVLAAYVEIMLACADVPAAQTAVDELDQVAALFRSPLLAASAAQWAGAVRLADDDAGAALPLLRRGWSGWRNLDVPYEAARCRVAIGLACRALGDEDAAQMELDAARWAFAQLAAEQDLARVEALVDPAQPSDAGTPPSHGLTAREVEVLRLVASGATNRAIAADLFLSEKTVARHLSNIFTKLGLPSRAAATAFAYQHGLL
jgi:ATP/maltotriose-dependent transcriptional regulator MalT